MSPADLTAARAIGLRLALLLVADRHDTTVKVLCGPQRHKEVWAARRDAYHTLRYQLGMSFPAIGKALGGRDHSTVMAGVRKHQDEIASVAAAGGAL